MATIRYMNARESGTVRNIQSPSAQTTWAEFRNLSGYSPESGDRISVLDGNNRIVNRSGADGASSLALSDSTILGENFLVQVTPGKSGGGLA